MSVTAGARLAFLSGLTGVSAQQHLRQIAGFYGVAAAMLVAFSGYPSAPAWVHLFPPESTESAVGGARGGYDADERVSPPRRKAVSEFVAAQPSLTEAERRLLDASLQAFFASGIGEDSAAGREAVRAFLDATVARMEMARADAARSAEAQPVGLSTQPADDAAMIAERRRLDNRRRAMILAAIYYYT